MSSKKDQAPKKRLHPRNKNRERYDLKALALSNPELKNYIKPNKLGVNSVDFSNPIAVKLLNKALLNYYYGIKYWDFPSENLCPPIPGRADYLHYMVDLLSQNNLGSIPTGDQIICFDIGIGANCIYPIIGVKEYGWKFIGSDIDSKSIESAQNIINSNPSLNDMIECRLQKNPKNIFHGIIHQDDIIDLSICNPPFHSSAEEALKGSKRKVTNLSRKKVNTPKLNFSGISKELICEGGEYQFIQNMIKESKAYSKNCYWFSTLVSKQSNLKSIYNALDKIGASSVKTIPMETGNKSSRIVAWTFLSEKERKVWRNTRWNIR